MNITQDQKTSQHRLREFRVIPKITQWELALRSGVKQSRISLIENYLVQPTLREKEKLAEALKQSIDEIFPNNINNGQSTTGNTKAN